MKIGLQRGGFLTDRRKPRAVKNVYSLPVAYHANKKACMTNEIFKEVLAKLDVDMTAQNRKIFLYIDNCAAHGHIDEMQSRLKAVYLAYFPPNTTSHLQPLDQGIIQSLKVHYRANMLSMGRCVL